MNARPLVRDHVTTEELLAVTTSTRDTLYRWVALRLLLKPRILTDTDGHYSSALARSDPPLLRKSDPPRDRDLIAELRAQPLRSQA